MYENYWNLREKPFRNVTDKKFFLYAELFEEAYLRLLYNITESQGLFLLLGEGGCGKSCLIKIFAQDLLDQGYRVALIRNPAVAPQEFLPQVLDEFGVNVSAPSQTSLYKEFKKLAAVPDQCKGYVLIVDDAHMIQDPKIWQDIRVLLNFENQNRFLISPILAGKPELHSNIEKSVLKDRVGFQYQLQPLNYRQTGEYIYHRMNKAGAAREIFSAEAVREVFTATQGIPREINKLCDLALLLGFGDNAIVVDRPLIQKAIVDLRGVVSSKAKVFQEI